MKRLKKTAGRYIDSLYDDELCQRNGVCNWNRCL